MKKNLTLIFFCIFYFTKIIAQNNIQITGVVTDSLKQTPVSFVTLMLYKGSQTTTPYRSVYTNETGAYKLDKIDTGKYTLIVTHSGFGQQQKSFFIGDRINLNFQLSKSSVSLQGVTINASKPLVEQTDDKVVYNAANDPAAKTETAIDILRKTPFVTVDGDNNVQVNGQTNFKVLLNGRETAMFSQNVKEALKGFPGALITKIEVITNPSAKYDAEGVGGIINIITKKKVAGYNGSVSSYYSSLNTFNQSLNLSVKSGKLGVTGYYSLYSGKNQRGRSLVETTPKVPSVFEKRTIAGNRVSSNFYNFGNLELSYEVDSLNTISGYGNISGGYFKSINDQQIEMDYASSPDETGSLFLNNRYDYPTTGAGLDFIRKFRRNKEKEFSIRLNGQFSDNNGFNETSEVQPAYDRFVRNSSKAANKEYTLQSDYILPLTKQKKLESGIKLILRDASSNYISMLKYNEADPYILNPLNSDVFSYRQQVYSAYSSLNFKVRKSSVRVGLRWEHTNIHADFNSSAMTVDQNYNTFIPNIQITKKLKPSYTAILSYSMRIQRPYITNLNPFVSNNDSLNINYGNPHLGPQKIHTVSVQNRITKGQSFAGITFSGSYSNNMIVQVANFNKTTGVTATTSENAGREVAVSMSVNMNTKFSKDWSLSVNGLVRYNNIRNNSLPEEGKQGFSGNMFANSSYKVTPKFTISGSGGFYRSQYTLLNTGNFNGWYQVNFGYKFLKDKLSATVNFNNFLKKDAMFRSTNVDKNFVTEYTYINPYRTVFLGITWNFGKLTENVSKKKGVTNDDLLSDKPAGN